MSEIIQRELIRRFRIVNGKCIEDPNGPIESIIVLPDITPEENEKVKRKIEKDISALLGCEARFRN
jgi:hypothetical protein